MSEREVTESPRYQGSTEQIVYSFEFSAWGTPTSPTVTLYDRTDNQDVSTTCLNGSASISSTKVLTPTVKNLENGHKYALTAQATVTGNVLSMFCDILCQDYE
jgi:hypothetical protein